MRSYLEAIDHDTRGARCDVTPLFADPTHLRDLAVDLANPFRGSTVTRVACIDALGFILGTAVALELRTGVVPIRKSGKLPVDADREPFVDYTGSPKALEIRSRILDRSDRILLVDEWSETGAQLRAACSLVEGQGASVVGIAAIHIDRSDTTAALARRFPIHTADTVFESAGLPPGITPRPRG